MLSKFLVAVIVFIIAFVVLAAVNVAHAGLISLAIAIAAFLFAPRDANRF